MSLRRAVLFGAWVLVATNLLLAFGTVALLTRMAPAIATILEQNDVSLEASEEMLAVLASPPGRATDEERRDRFVTSYHRAERNITEKAERPILDGIRDRMDDALAGETSALRMQIASIREIAAINRSVMRNADLEAQRLCTAGAWAVVLLAVISFSVALLFMRKLNDRVLGPIQELRSTLHAAEQGDLHRRCTSVGLPIDLRTLMQSVNGLLDRVQQAQARTLPGEE